MNLTTLTQGEPWMTPEERQLNLAFIQSATEFLATRNVQETPLIALRVNDVIVTWLLARRLETALTPTESGAAPCPTLAQAGAITRSYSQRWLLARAVFPMWCIRPAVKATSGSTSIVP